MIDWLESRSINCLHCSNQKRETKAAVLSTHTLQVVDQKQMGTKREEDASLNLSMRSERKAGKTLEKAGGCYCCCHSDTHTHTLITLIKATPTANATWEAHTCKQNRKAQPAMGKCFLWNAERKCVYYTQGPGKWCAGETCDGGWEAQGERQEWGEKV